MATDISCAPDLKAVTTSLCSWQSCYCLHACSATFYNLLQVDIYTYKGAMTATMLLIRSCATRDVCSTIIAWHKHALSWCEAKQIVMCVSRQLPHRSRVGIWYSGGADLTVLSPPPDSMTGSATSVGQRKAQHFAKMLWPMQML